jgi:ankyrin repeat protein
MDNLFRAAIESKDELVVQQLLEHQLVDVNNTVCFFKKQGYTPLERAASLEAFGLIQLLIRSGADVHKTYHRKGDITTHLIDRLIGAVREEQYGHLSSAVVASTDLIKTVDVLLKAGTTATAGNFIHAGNTFAGYDLAYRLSLSILPSAHQSFFKVLADTYYSDDPMQQFESPIEIVARYSDDRHASMITLHMIKLCEVARCNECLSKHLEEVEQAAVSAAERGHSKLIHILIDHVPSFTRIFSASIRSKRSDLVDLIISRTPKLDPPAHSLGRHHSPMNTLDQTTPLAEAVRAENENLINHLEAAGGLKNLHERSRFEPLIIAASQAGNIPYIEKLLALANSSSHPLRISGLAIKLAIENHHTDVAGMLLANGAMLPSLSSALKSHNALLVRAMLNIRVSHIDGYEWMKAIEWGEASIISSLISYNISFSTDFGQFPFTGFCIMCMERDEIALFRKFVDSGFGSTREEIDSCLQAAVKMGHFEMVGYLLDIGANPLHAGAFKMAIIDRPDMVPLLLEKPKLRQAVPKCMGACVLDSIMDERPGNIEALEALLETGAVNFIRLEEVDEDSNTGFTPLGLALSRLSGCFDKRLSIVKRLLQAGSDPDSVARAEYLVTHTGLMLAIETGREDVVSLLITHGANVNKEPAFGTKRTPLQYAAELGNLDMVRLLLGRGANVNGEPSLHGGGTALQFAAISGNCNIAVELLGHGAQLDMLPSKVDGRWPLEAAAEHGRLDMIQFLWKVRQTDPALVVSGFDRRHCLRAMNFAGETGHLGCRDLISELSGISVDTLEVENYGAPWLAY